jgi:type I restriction enzyme S subunit
MQWVREPLGDICRKGKGRIQTGPFGSQLHESDYSLDGTPVVMPADIADGKVAVTRIARVVESHVERLKRHKLVKGDIVYGRRGDIGRQALVRDENVGWLCGTGCLKITLGNGPLSYEFLHRYLSTNAVISWIEGQAVGATMPNLNTGILERVPVFYPIDRATQKKIVAILSAYDELIENNQRRIVLLEKMAEEIYREWFVRLRFPGHEKIKKVKGVPEGWQPSCLGEVAKFTMGQSPSSEFYNKTGDGLPFHQGVGTYGERFPQTISYCSTMVGEPTRATFFSVCVRQWDA